MYLVKKEMEKHSYYDAVKNAQKHAFISQYTDLCALKKIISNKTLRLTRVDVLNDKLENEYLPLLWKNKVYVSCFTHREYESYFFWSTYCNCKHCGVMITFQTNQLQNLSIYPDEKCQESPLELCKRSNLNAEYCENVSAKAWGIYDNSCLDITYIPRNEKLEADESFQGRIKYYEWDMECETRVRVTIRPKCLEYKQVGTKLKHLPPPVDKYLYAKLTSECLESITITLSPFANTVALREEVEKLLEENGLYGKVNIIDSVLSKELN